MKNRHQILLITCLSLVVLLTAILVITYRPGPSRMRFRKEILTERQLRNREILRQLGQAYSDMEKGDVNTAEKSLKKILREHPTHTMANQLLGQVYYQTSRYRQAEEIYREMIRRNEFDASAYNNLGQVLSRQKRYTEALTALLHSKKLNPNNMTVYINLSVVYAALNRHEDAREMFMAAHCQLLQKQQQQAESDKRKQNE